MSEALLSPKALEAIRAIEESKRNQKLWSRDAVRLQTALLLCMAMACNSLMRGSMSLAIVCIVARNVFPTTANNNDTTVAAPAEDRFNGKCPAFSFNAFKGQGKFCFKREYQVDWTSEEQGRIHTAYYIGAFLAILATDYIIRRYDPKPVLSVALLLNAIGSICAPFSVILLQHHLYLAAVRFLMGFGSGLIAPCGLFIISKWFPMTEKSTAVAVFTTGNQLGIGLSMIFTAKLCQATWGGGWPLAFIGYGLLTLVYVIIWQFRGSSRPRCSKYITATELEYITGRRGIKSRAKSVVLKTPWKEILFSRCVSAICVNAFAQSFVLVAMITYLPKFNQEALGMDVATNGMWCSVPFFVQTATKMLFGMWADAMKKRGCSSTAVTWAFNGVATFAASFFIVAAPLAAASPTLSMLCVCAAMALFGAFVPGYNTAVVCVAPEFTATISSYQQFYSQIGSLLAPFLIGIITRKGTYEEWRTVYLMLAFVLIIAGLFYQIWGHGNAEPWGKNDGSQLTSICIENGELDEKGDGTSRQSSRDCEANIPETIYELENDVIEEESDLGDEKADKLSAPMTRRRLLSKDPDPEMVNLTGK
ncbi:unnamed protein product, partial [Mesorhabditis spiculigera]